LTREPRKLCTFITKKGIQKILATSRSIVPSVIQKFLDNPFIQSIGIKMNVVYLKKEQEYINAICDAFDTTCHKQYSVKTFKIDLYMPEHNLAIECDEFDHYHRNADYEKNRERKIRYELGCNFFRFNPDEQNFNIYRVIANISNKMNENKIKKFKELEDEKDDRIAELNDRIKDMMDQKKEWKQKEMKWENEREEWKNEREEWKNERETLLEQNTLLLKQLSLQKK